MKENKSEKGMLFMNIDDLLAYTFCWVDDEIKALMGIMGGINGAVLENTDWGKYEAISHTLMLSLGWHCGLSPLAELVQFQNATEMRLADEPGLVYRR